MTNSMINIPPKSNIKTAILFIFIIMNSPNLSAQTRNLTVEGNGDQMGVIHSTNANTSGLELIRGNNLSQLDWRIVNDNGEFKVQSQTNNFLTNGLTRISLNDSGYLNILTGEEASLSENGYLMLGGLSTQNLVLDQNEIQARTAVGAASLFIQAHGGDLVVDGNTFYVDASANEIGIGTASPQNKLHIMGGSDAGLEGGGYFQMGNITGSNIVMDQNEIMARRNGVASPLYFQNDGGEVSMGVSSGSLNAKLNIQDTGHQMYIRNENDTANDWWIGASAPTWSVGANKFIFDDDSNSNNPLLMLDGAVDGVGINTNVIPNGYRFAVNGNIICEEVRVELESAWPDYVFKEDYRLRSIEELEKSIQENGHLPGIPSAKEVENEGLQLGDMQKRMMEKIEELSLYVIQQNKRIIELNNQMVLLKTNPDEN